MIYTTDNNENVLWGDYWNACKTYMYVLVLYFMSNTVQVKSFDVKKTFASNEDES